MRAQTRTRCVDETSFIPVKGKQCPQMRKIYWISSNGLDFENLVQHLMDLERTLRGGHSPNSHGVGRRSCWARDRTRHTRAWQCSEMCFPYWLSQNYEGQGYNNIRATAVWKEDISSFSCRRPYTMGVGFSHFLVHEVKSSTHDPWVCKVTTLCE